MFSTCSHVATTLLLTLLLPLDLVLVPTTARPTARCVRRVNQVPAAQRFSSSSLMDQSGTESVSVSDNVDVNVDVSLSTESKSFTSSSFHSLGREDTNVFAPEDNGKKVFAHFMVGIVSAYTEEDWRKDMTLAMSRGIDGFALNIGVDDYTERQTRLAYKIAEQIGFLVFISFDFNWFSVDNTPPIISLLNQFADLPAQFRVDGAAFVSTFAGDGFDWEAVRSATGKNLFVVPNWQPTLENSLNPGINGLFSWYAWPSVNNGPLDQPMTLEHDMRYVTATKAANKVYMAPVSPWFNTHYGPEVSYSKNWLFKSESLWYDRWEQILSVQYEIPYIEVVTWNDYGESHYIGPLGTNHGDDGNSKWVDDMPHDALLEFAVPYIKAFKTGSRKPIIERDMLIYWYRPHLKSADCDATDNCGKRPDGHGIVGDTVFVASFLVSGTATVTVKSGDNPEFTKQVSAGVTLLEVPMGAGAQEFAMSGDAISLSGTSELEITRNCWRSTTYNFNVYSGMLSA